MTGFFAALTGCETTPKTTAQTYENTRPVRGLVTPSETMNELAPGRSMLSNDDWTAYRNDYALNPRPAVQPFSLQWVEIWHQERLRVSNGRPFESTSFQTRTWQLTPRR